MSLLLVTYVTTDCHMSPAPSLHTVSSDLLAFSCLQHFRCFGSRRSVVASLVPAVQRMGQPLSLPVPGAAAGNKCQSGEWVHALVPTALVPCHQASPCQVWPPAWPLPPQLAAVSWSRPCSLACIGVCSCEWGQDCWHRPQPQQAPHPGQVGLVGAADHRVWFSELEELTPD